MSTTFSTEEITLTHAGEPQISLVVFESSISEENKVLILEHGRNGRADAPHMLPIIETYLNKGYRVVSINAANSQWNDSDGKPKEFTMEQHVVDMHRAVEWARSNAHQLAWDGKKFAIAGHSMGGYSSLFLAATEFADQISHVLGVSPVSRGQLQLDVKLVLPNGLEKVKKELLYALEEWPLHDIYEHIENLKAPVTLIVGASDGVTPPKDVMALYSQVRNPMGLAIIPDEDHCMSSPEFAIVLQTLLHKAL